MLNTRELKLRRDDSFAVMLQDLELLKDRKNVFFWEIVHIVLLNICRTVVWLQQQLFAGRPLGFVSNWRNLLELDRRFLCCKTLTISQDRQNTYILRILFRLWSWKIAGWPVLQLHAMCGNWVVGLASSGEVLSDHGELAKCWRFKALSSVDILEIWSVCKSLYASQEIKWPYPEGVSMTDW